MQPEFDFASFFKELGLQPEMVGAQAVWFATPAQFQNLEISLTSVQLVSEEVAPFFELRFIFVCGAFILIIKGCESVEKAEEMLHMALSNIGVMFIKIIV
jgi:hypothetical protein